MCEGVSPFFLNVVEKDGGRAGCDCTDVAADEEVKAVAQLAACFSLTKG